MWVPLRRDSRGIESQLATNYLGQFHLTAALWESLKNTDGARVINVSSYGHQMSPFDFNDPNFEHRTYETLLGYGQSKTASNLLQWLLMKEQNSMSVPMLYIPVQYTAQIWEEKSPSIYISRWELMMQTGK